MHVLRLSFFRSLATLVCIALLALTVSPAQAGNKKKPPAKKAAPAAPAYSLSGRLKALGLKPSLQKFGTAEKGGVNLYAEVPPTRLPSKGRNGKPKRINNYWSVFVAPRLEPAAGEKLDEGIAGVIDLARAMTENKVRGGGLFVVFLDQNARGAAEAFAVLVTNTKRTVTSVNCRGLNRSENERGPEYDCKESFAKWGMPATTGYRPNQP